MNLWDVIAAIGGELLKQSNIGNELVKQVNKEEERFEKRTIKKKSVQEYKKKYENLDHNELVKRYRSSNGDAKLAAGLLLKDEKKKNPD